MANVLGELFSEIAESIRGGLGDIGTMKPNAFPDRIDEIVELLQNAGSGDGGGGSGGSGSVSQKNTKVQQGSFTTSDTGLGRRYINHTLGDIPDFAAVYLSETTGDIKAENRPLTFSCGFRKNMISGASFYGINCFLGQSELNNIGADTLIADATVESYRPRVYFDSTRIQVGTDRTDYGHQFLPNSTYRWIAYTGLGSVITGSSADIRYVTFMDDTGTKVLGKKAVAVGDDCADPIARGVFDTPTKESTPQYSYTFSGGWATTPGGGKDANALKAVTEDRTVYANFISALRYYTITYYDDDGVTVLKTQSVAYGATPSYTATKGDHIFTGWTPALSVVTGDASYTANWVESVDFAAASWETIAARSADGSASTLWKIGDTKSITYTHPNGTTINNSVKIIAFNHDETKDGTKVGITFALAKADNSLSMNDASVTYGSFTGYYAGGWQNCKLRTTLNGAVFNSLDEGLKSVIKEVKKVTDYSIVTKLSETDETKVRKQSTTYDKLWLFSLGEIGKTITSDGGVVFGNDGNKYTSHDPVTQCNYDTSKSIYWLRTAGPRYTERCCCYNSSGKSVGQPTALSFNDLVFGFCI
jgi:hypothetical protein